MNDTSDEAAGLGAADPVTGVTGAADDLADNALLQDDEEPEDTPESAHAAAQTTVTNDAVAGETVEPGLGDGNDGPTGGAPAEATPLLPDNELAGQDIDLS